jgi:small subunit ribosomal protein S9|tara:strand:- start:137 stop:526 length:390 start_codon:yes stop_codon:yes gene_type:complete
MEERCYATGKRKSSIARVWLKQGDGNISVNKKILSDYFSRDSHISTTKEPLTLANVAKQYDVLATVKGGGHSGQAGALMQAITKALVHSDPSLRLILKRAGLLTRDSRVKERKKYGQKGARKRFQFSKR